MGILCTRQSQNPPKSPPIDSSSYTLGQNRIDSIEKPSYDFNVNQLNFIPDSESIWEPQPPPARPISVIEQSPTKLRLPPYINYSSKMPIEHNYKCDQCGMVFPTDDTLFKHKTRFCIGVKDSGIGRKPLYSDDDYDEDFDDYTKRSKARKVIRHRTPIEKKRDEIYDWKQQRSALQAVEDMEDRVRIDTYKNQKIRSNIKKQDDIYSEILLDYERLQNQERDVLRQMYNLQIEPKSRKHSRRRLKQPSDLTNSQQNLLEELQRKNLRLERERHIIQEKLEELIANNYQTTTMANYEPYRFLREMKEQHELNEKALSFLRGRLILHDSNALSTVSDIPTLPYIHTRQTRSRRTDGDNIRDFRNSYLQSGGHDPNVIARYSDIEYRLRAYEDYPWSSDYPEPLRPSRYQQRRTLDPQTERLKLATEENHRLQYELDEIHRQFDTLNTRTRQLEIAMATNGMSKSIDNHRPLSSKTDPYPQSQPSVRDHDNNDQTDQRQNHHQTALPLLDKRVTPRASPAMSLLNSNMNKLRDPLAPQSYDPIGGFLIFFDFILNLPSTIEQCCLITCLYHPKSGLGEPSQLEIFRCEPYTDENNGERMSVALIATKQPVPRCPPQQALTVVIEVQTLTNKQAASNEELRTTAWTKLPLFDNKNRLLSGRWKVPLKSLPIHHDESLAIISTLPTYERAELHYRLVNAQDGVDQSNAPLSPSFRDLYIYPLQYRN